MKISHDQICRYILGCLNAEEAEDGLVFHRMNSPMKEIYAANGPGAVLRMNCGSGVRIRFRTNSKNLRVRLFFVMSWTKDRIYRVILRVNDGDALAFGPELPQDAMVWEDTLFREKTAKYRIFDLWFPHVACFRLLDLEIDDNSKITEAPQLPLRYLAYGDSITQGMQARLPTGTYPALVAQDLQAELLNFGVGGAKLQMELADSIPEWPYDFATVAYGTNDANTQVPPEIFAANARRLLASLTGRNPGKPIFAISVIPWIVTEKNREIRLDLYRDALADAVGGIPEVILVDGTSLIPADPVLFVDGVHPNDQGFAIYARNLLSAIRPHLVPSDPGKDSICPPKQSRKKTDG